MKPLVSILIPAFNSERWIAETIQSALDQTWQRKEIVIVDDGSSDQTLKTARSFASKNVKIISQGNQGAAAARNKAYSVCEGDLIQWLDADDVLAPDKIARQIETLDCRGGRRTLVSGAWGHFRHRCTRAKFSPTTLWKNLSPIDWLLPNLNEGVFLQPGSWLVSRELTEAAGPWDVRLSLDDDGEYFSRVVRAGDFVQFVPEAKVFYRRSGFQSLGNIHPTDKKLASLHLSMQLQIANIRALEDSVRVRSACLAFLQRYLIYFYPERANIVTQLEQLARELGGDLKNPKLSWKYGWIQRAFGWTAAKRTQLLYNEWKWKLLASCERAMPALSGELNNR